MNEMFSEANEFNGDISNWDVSSVTDMFGMFMAVGHLIKIYHLGMSLMFYIWGGCLLFS